jgi:TnpA family transposase
LRSFIRDEGRKLCKEDALDIPPEVKQLKKQIGAAMPLVRIEKLIAEVDKLSGFSCAFQPIQKSVGLSIPKKPLYGVITAQATNIGLYAMGQCNYGITASVLRDASERYVTPDNIRDANALLIQCHRSYPISRVHGKGRYSSSDGQRYAIEASFMDSSYYPRYYGYYEKAISLYTHISDQYSVFNTQVISCSAREATYVLDGLLLNNTEINPEFHCTDTHGYTDHIFALCYLLGFSFQPRLKDLPHQALYKMDKKDKYELIDDLFTGVTDMQLVKEEWDTIVRVGASLKNGLAPAHVIIQRLANRGDKVAKALQAFGRVIKTIYILRYVCDPELRRHVHLQLNRGESRHSLAKVIFFDNRGVFKTSDYEEIMNKASCLSLVSNAVLVWNTHHMQQIVDRMRREGYQVEDDILARISPLSLKNIITHGMYDFVEVD